MRCSPDACLDKLISFAHTSGCLGWSLGALNSELCPMSDSRGTSEALAVGVGALAGAVLMPRASVVFGWLWSDGQAWAGHQGCLPGASLLTLTCLGSSWKAGNSYNVPGIWTNLSWCEAKLQYS